MFYYTYEMDLEYFASENDLELAEDDLGNLYIFACKKNNDIDKIKSLIEESGFDLEVEEFKEFYKLH